MIKAASIGLGWWSDELAKSIQGKSKKIKIVSCYSRSKKKRIEFSKKYKINCHDSYRNIINDPNIDAVILTTPHSLHSKHAIQAMKNGKHVFVEKPMATKYHDAKKMIKAAKKYKKILSVGHNRRYSSVSDFINNLAKSGIVERAMAQTQYQESQKLTKTDGKKIKRILDIEKLEDARLAGTKNGGKCSLILTEGDSAKATAVTGLSSLENGRDFYGIFPLRGKLLNTRDKSDIVIADNKEIFEKGIF